VGAWALALAVFETSIKVIVKVFNFSNPQWSGQPDRQLFCRSAIMGINFHFCICWKICIFELSSGKLVAGLKCSRNVSLTSVSEIGSAISDGLVCFPITC
jgi:hypothetical protein